MQKAWPFHAFSSVAAQPSNEAKAFVIPITDDNCHVMKLRICRIYGPTLTMPFFLCLVPFSPYFILNKLRPLSATQKKCSQYAAGRSFLLQLRSVVFHLLLHTPPFSPQLLLTFLILFSTFSNTRLSFSRVLEAGFSACSLFSHPKSC